MPSRYTEDSNDSTVYSIGAVSDIPSTPSRVTYETASDMNASIFTCHSPSYDCSYLASEPPSDSSSQPLEVITDTSCGTPSTLTTDVPDTTASTSHPSDPATESTTLFCYTYRWGRDSHGTVNGAWDFRTPFNFVTVDEYALVGYGPS